MRYADLPFIDEAVHWAKQGTVTGASERNWSGYGKEIRLPEAMPEWQRALITDPQTSGGLLVACAADTVAQVLAEAKPILERALAIHQAQLGPEHPMSVVGVNTLSRRGEAQMNFTVEVSDAASLRRALAQVGDISGVFAARRR